MLALASLSCAPSRGSGPQGQRPTRAPTIPVELGPDTTALEINRLAVSSPHELRSAALARIDDRDPGVRRSALYALSLTVTKDDPEAIAALKRFLESDSDVERLRSAGGLLSVGEKAAVPVLVDLLASDAEVPNADPPLAVWRVARGLLLTSTDRDLGLRRADGVEAAGRTRAEWRTWWATSGDRLEWDAATRRFR